MLIDTENKLTAIIVLVSAAHIPKKQTNGYQRGKRGGWISNLGLMDAQYINY